MRQIHAENLAAGADVLTANTFRTTPRAFAAAGAEEPEQEAEAATLLAVRLARQAIAASGRRAFVAGSIAPLEDCYRPDLVPEDAALEREHRGQAARLARAGCDLLLVETMNTIREAGVATRAAVASGRPVWTSLVVGPGGRLLSGEPVAEAAQGAVDAGAVALLVNCSSPDDTDAALELLGGLPVPLGAYANAGSPAAAGGAVIRDVIDPDEYARRSERWVAAGVRILGSCCGTDARHVAALARRWRRP